MHLILCVFSFEVSVTSMWTRRFPSWGNWFTTRTSSSYWIGTTLRVRSINCIHRALLLCYCVSVFESVLLCAEPYMLIMEYVSYGTLRTYLQANRSHLSDDPELQSLLTIASYHIALAMQHLRSKMVTAWQTVRETLNCIVLNNVTIYPHWPNTYPLTIPVVLFTHTYIHLQIVHCDLALRNIMVSKFPWEVKVAEFGLARDLTLMTSRRSSRWRNPRVRPYHPHTVNSTVLMVLLLLGFQFSCSVKFMLSCPAPPISKHDKSNLRSHVVSTSVTFYLSGHLMPPWKHFLLFLLHLVPCGHTLCDFSFHAVVF